MNEKKPTSQQKEVHKILEDIAANEFHKEWSVSQEDIHFAVHMFDRHELVSPFLIEIPNRVERSGKKIEFGRPIARPIKIFFVGAARLPPGNNKKR